MGHWGAMPPRASSSNVAPDSVSPNLSPVEQPDGRHGAQDKGFAPRHAHKHALEFRCRPRVTHAR
eukprot:3451378-Pyramimonas_sp.AAC.1